ncbi:ABC transporter permease [Ectobacillus antri]|jgi:ABC-2 type transport system permease protein|uniref:ABC transporter permease n=1 Tax=Ectobacillus antri TaxID=2486280 RepID=A0ABT6H4T6_9BACI|nr:ABC transporter permease [Ectobacillus antri]MDG4656958.1 ABC transporter permease [Ectobacillus antri]MDG5754060.1 ABC transporter permease [Ectobacillus antri]
MRITALVKRIFKQMSRDKRTMALLFVAPLLILTLMSLVFNGDEAKLKLGVQNVSESIVKQLEDTNIHVVKFSDASNVKEVIKEKELDGFLKITNEQTTITLLNSDPTTAKGLLLKIKQAISSEALQHTETNTAPLQQSSIQTKYVYGSEDTEVFDVFSPILIGFFVLFFVFLISGIGLLNEKTTGTLERLMATPIRRWEIVTAYLIGFGTFAVIQTVIVVLYAVHVLDIIMVGSIGSVILINLLLALVALSLGLLLSSFATSEFQMMQFIPIVAIPQVFFSGIFPLESMANWLQWIGKIMPLYYAGHALKGVMYKGVELYEVRYDLYVLLAFATAFIILNLFALKKYRKL